MRRITRILSDRERILLTHIHFNKRATFAELRTLCADAPARAVMHCLHTLCRARLIRVDVADGGDMVDIVYVPFKRAA